MVENFELIPQPNLSERGWLRLTTSKREIIAVGNPSEKQYIGIGFINHDEQMATFLISERKGEAEVILGTVELEKEIKYKLKNTALKIYWATLIDDPNNPNISLNFLAPKNVDMKRIREENA